MHLLKSIIIQIKYLQLFHLNFKHELDIDLFGEPLLLLRNKINYVSSAKITPKLTRFFKKRTLLWVKEDSGCKSIYIFYYISFVLFVLHRLR